MAFTTWIDGRNHAVIDGRPGAAFDSIAWPPAMCADGAVIAYAARLGEDQYCVVGERKGAAYRHVGHPVITADGRTIAYPADDATGAFVVIDERRGPAFRWVGNVVLSRDGRHIAYGAEDGQLRSFIAVDHRPGPLFERVTAPALSEDGSAVAYGAREKGRWRLIHGDRRVPVEGEIASVFISRDGRHAGCIVEEGRTYRVVVEGVGGPRFDWIAWPMFAPDGHTIYFASRGRTKVVIVGGRELELGDWIVWDPVLSDDGVRVSFGARIGRELWRKVITLL